MDEAEVLENILSYLESDWTIICICPPGGSSFQYAKCILPRRDGSSLQRSRRDEVDLMAYNEDTLLMLEAKPRLSDSFTKLNALGENDYEKLKRLVNTHQTGEIARLTTQATGVSIPPNLEIVCALGVGEVNHELPIDMDVFSVSEDGKIQYFSIP
ncbi:hypothetical protein N9V58_02360 [Candidatus Poseidoniales archaeon]|nr:hypothetical protein [Candidatus Poseidoniales archaeon]